MTTADLSRDPDPDKQPALVRVDVYNEWRQRENAPLVGGIYLNDMNAVEVGPWPRKGDGVKGALCYLDGDDETDEHIVELPGGGSTAPLRHMYTEAIYVLSGRGSTTVWREEGAKQTFEWGPGSYFVLPTNAWHQFFNASLSQSARWFSVTDLPELLRRWASEDYVFNNSYDFQGHVSDWIDRQQLIYLADKRVHVVTADRKMLGRIKGSDQEERVLLYRDFLASARAR